MLIRRIVPLITLACAACQAQLAPPTAPVVTTTPAPAITTAPPTGITTPVSTPSLAPATARQPLLQTSAPLGYPPPSTQQGTLPPGPPTPTPAPFIPGIFDTDAAPVPRSGYTMTKYWWQDIVNGEEVAVFAGARQYNVIYPPGPAQGIVFVRTIGRDLRNYSLQDYDAPTGTGILTITAVSGQRLVLQTDRRGTLYFDIPSRQFVNGLNVTSHAPTATPLPTITTTPTTGTPGPYPGPQTTSPSS